MSLKVRTSPVKNLTRVPPKTETDANGFVSLLEAGKIDEASRVISRMLDFNKAENVHKILQEFLKGGNFDESLEMLTLIANLSRKHQVKLLKLFICSGAEIDSKEPHEKKVRRLIDDIGFIERMKITSLEIYLSLANRIVALSGIQQNSNSEILNLFGSFIYPALLECEISEQVPYLDWLNLALLSDYTHQSSTHVTLSQFGAQVKQWSVIEQAFNMVEPQKSLVFSSLATSASDSANSAVNNLQTSLLDLWIVFRANVRLWSCERTSLYLASFLCGFASLWKILSNIFPKITCVPLACTNFSSDFDHDEVSRLKQIEESLSVSSYGNIDQDLSFLFDEVHLSHKTTSLIKSSLVQSESRSHLLQCLIFLSDVREFFDEDLYNFKMSVKMAINALNQMRLLQNEVMETFCGLLGNFIPAASEPTNTDVHINQINQCAVKVVKSLEPKSKGGAIRNLVLEIKLNYPNIEILGLPFATFGSSCLVNDSIDVVNYAFTLLVEFLLNQNLESCFADSNLRSSKLGFTFALLQFCWPSFYGFYCKLLHYLKQCNLERPLDIFFGKMMSNVIFVNELVQSIIDLVNSDVLQISVDEIESQNDQNSSKQALSKIESCEYLTSCLNKTRNDDISDLNSKLFKFVLENVDQYLMLN